jgi:hypothetical protein
VRVRRVVRGLRGRVGLDGIVLRSALIGPGAHLRCCRHDVVSSVPGREADNRGRHKAGIGAGICPLCQRDVRQLPLDISVPMGGEWFPERAQAFPDSRA